jgi:hypothetical protein
VNHKLEAERLKVGLARGWIPVAACVAWADKIIASEGNPELAVIDVASAASLDRSEVANLLSHVSGTADPVDVMRRCLFDLREWVGMNEDRGRQAAAYLYEAVWAGALPPEHFGNQPYRLDDAFSLADSGVFGTRKEAMADLLGFFDTHARGV